MSWLFDNRGKIVVVSPPDGKAYQPAVISVANIDSECYLLRFTLGKRLSHNVRKSLDDTFYYQEFGEDIVPLQIFGIAFESGSMCGMCGGGEDTTGLENLLTFWAARKAVGSTPTTVVITLGNVDESSTTITTLLVDMQIDYAVGELDVPIFSFKLVLIPLD